MSEHFDPFFRLSHSSSKERLLLIITFGKGNARERPQVMEVAVVKSLKTCWGRNFIVVEPNPPQATKGFWE